MRRIRNFLIGVVALPILQIINLVAYSRQKQGRPAQIMAFVSFIPIVAISTAVWVAAWWFAITAIGAILKADIYPL